MASEHAKKVEKLKDRASRALEGSQPPVAQAHPTPIIVHVCLFPLSLATHYVFSPKVNVPVQSESEPLPAPKKPLAHLHLRVTGCFLKPRH